jgi:hypothetical protein
MSPTTLLRKAVAAGAEVWLEALPIVQCSIESQALKSLIALASARLTEKDRAGEQTQISGQDWLSRRLDRFATPGNFAICSEANVLLRRKAAVVDLARGRRRQAVLDPRARRVNRRNALTTPYLETLSPERRSAFRTPRQQRPDSAGAGWTNSTTCALPCFKGVRRRPGAT